MNEKPGINPRILFWPLLVMVLVVVLFAACNVADAQGSYLRECMDHFDNLAWYPGYTPLTETDLNNLAAILDAPYTRIRWLGYEGEFGPGQYAVAEWDTPDDLECQWIVPRTGFGRTDHRFITQCESGSVPGVLFIWTNDAPPTNNGVNVGHHHTCAAMVRNR